VCTMERKERLAGCATIFSSSEKKLRSSRSPDDGLNREDAAALLMADGEK
jgi:hypothetical protein